MQEKTKLAIAGGVLAVTAIFPIQASVSADSEASEKGTVTATSLYVRAEPSVKGEVLGSLKKGQTVSIIMKEKGWATIHFNGKTGYISLEHVRTAAGPALQQETDVIAESATVIAANVNVRKTPSTNGIIAEKLKKGDTVRILSKENGWARVEYNGKQGYVSLTYLKTEAASVSVTSTATAESGTVTATKLNVRQAASTNSAVIGNLKKGEKVKVISKANGWAQIEYSGKQGYVLLTYLKVEAAAVEPTPAPTPTPAAETGTVTATKLNVRQAASANSTVIGSLKQGEKVQVISKANGWARIEYSGKRGYVLLTYLKVEAVAVEPTPAPTPTPAAETGTVTATKLNVRQAASANSTVIGSLKKGEKVQVISKANGWARIEYSGKQGYVLLTYLKVEAAAAEPTPTPSPTPAAESGTVTATKLNMRQAASTNSAVIGSLMKGEKVQVISKANGWAQIEYSGKQGYVLLTYLKVEAAAVEPTPTPTPTPAAESGTVTATKLNVRQAASTNSAVIGSLKQGDQVKVVGKANGWAQIEYSGKQGYVLLTYLKVEAAAVEPTPTPSPTPAAETGTVTATTLNVRQSASMGAAVIGTLKQGDKVKVINKENGWATIDYNGKSGYVSLAFVQIEDKAQEPPAAEKGTVIAALLNVRKEASLEGAVVGTLKKGETIDVLSKEGDWAVVEYNGSRAYVSLRYISFDQSEPPKVIEQKKIAISEAEVKEKASYSSASIGVLKQGELVNVLSQEGDWVKIQYNNREAYVQSLAFQSPSQEEYGTVTASVLNVRSAPSGNAAIVGKLKKGDSAVVIGKENGWAKLRFNGGDAYASLDYLSLETSSVSYVITTSSGKIIQSSWDTASQTFSTLTEDGYVTRNGKIVDMKQGFVRTNGVVSIYSQETGKQLTYVAKNTDLQFVKSTGDRAIVKVDGSIGYVSLQEVTLYPGMLQEPTSYYVVQGEKLFYKLYNPSSKTYYSYEIGYAPSHLQEGVQYEVFDKTAIGGKESYQYFQYVSLRSTADYTAQEIDSFLKVNRPDSPLIGKGAAFVEAANKYHINVGYLLTHAVLESAWGTSKIARDKNNLFGFQAVDSNPYEGAASFKTLEEGIDYCAKYISENYLMPAGAMYNGAILGDKSRGMNVLYASDSNWSQQIASLMYKLDKMYGNRDLNTYKLGVMQADAALWNVVGGKKAGAISKGSMITIKSSVETNQGLYYEVVSDNSSYGTVYVEAKDVRLVTSY